MIIAVFCPFAGRKGTDLALDKKAFRNIALLILLAAGALLAVLRFDSLTGAASLVMAVIAPMITGFAIAYILNKPFKSITSCLERLLGEAPKADKWLKPLAIVLTYLLFFGVVVLIFAILIPQLAVSVQTMAANIGIYAQNLEAVYHWFMDLLPSAGIEITDFTAQLEGLYQKVMGMLGDMVPALYGFTQGVVRTVTNLVVGFVVSFYLLFDKAHLKSQAKRMLYAYLPKKWADPIVDVTSLTNETFSKFISGQLTEACILGVLCFISMTFLRYPYALLISVIIGITNMIPIVGPILGTIPGAFILLMADPMKAVWFVVLIIALQQVDGNFIYPRVVGNSVGLPALWVLVAITVGGGLFGLLGMILAVPTFSVIYKLLKKDTAQRLGLPDPAEKP